MKEAKRIKYVLFGPILMNIGLMIITFVIGASIHTHKLPAWIHGCFFLGGYATIHNNYS